MKKIWLNAILLLALSLSGCASDIHKEENAAYTFGIVLKTMDAEHWMEIRAGMEKAAAERDIRIILQYPSNELATTEQKTILRDMLAEPIDALLFSPCDSGDTARLILEANEKKLPLFTVDTRATDGELPYIGSDNRGIGRMAYEYLSERLHENGKIGIITGTSHQASLSDRVSGFRFFCTRDQHIEIVCMDTDCNDYAGAYRTAYRQMTEEDVSAIFCTSGVIGMGAVTAREELGRNDITLIAVDTQSDVLNAVREGRLDALITQSGYDIGYQAVADAYDALNGGEPPPEHYIPNILLTAETVDTFLEEKEENDEKSIDY